MVNVQKLNNLAVRMGLGTLIALMFVHCKSNTDKQNQLESEIQELEIQINKLTNDCDTIYSPDIIKIHERNLALTDSIRNAKIQHIAKKYPLNKFLSPSMLKIIQDKLRRGCCEYNKPFAKRIINGHGTLFDLYNVSFEIGFADLSESFSITDVVGTVRFGDEKRDAMCQKFDDEIFTIYTTPQSNSEIQNNQKKIHERDSIYVIAKKRIDSLQKIKNDKYNLLISTKANNK